MLNIKDKLPMKNDKSGKFCSGFTLIEMLVVMVILALTTGLLTEGLSTTWRSFEKLSSRDLASSSAQLPLSWFEQSVAAALLYHPEHAIVKGKSHSFEFITFASPDDPKQIPQHVVWRISAENNSMQNNQWVLSFQSETSIQFIQVATFAAEPRFEYWNGQSWQLEFLPKDGQLPIAMRIFVAEDVWAMAKPERPVLADMPGELAQFGDYEF
jgi:general secretion pathway protein J